MPPDLRITLVILTYNRIDELTRTLVRAKALPEQPALIVVDNGASDPVAMTVRRIPGALYLSMPHNLGAAARNAGAARAATPYVAFSDDDTAWMPGSLGRAADLLDRHPRVAVISARVLVGPEQRLDPACEAMAASPLPSDGLPGPALLGFLAGACVFRREAFLQAGGYEPRLFIGGEERLLALELAARGWRMAYVPSLTVLHNPSPRRDSALRRRLLARNLLWTSWLRAPALECVRSAGRVVRRALRDPAAARGLLDAARGLRWTLRQRRVVPPAVAAMMRRLER
jgi:GT2 family glycosyltransferase